MSRGQYNSPFNKNSPDVNRQSQSFKESLSPSFIPFGYSSPLSSMKSGRNFNKPYNKNVMRFHDSGSFSSPSSNASSSLFSPNSNSFGSLNSNWSGPYNRSNNYNRHRKHQFRNPNNKGYQTDLYFHSSMIEDPWAILEKKLINDIGAENIKIVDRHVASSDVSENKGVSSSEVLTMTKSSSGCDRDFEVSSSTSNVLST